jgi:hypothetical protein
MCEGAAIGRDLAAPSRASSPSFDSRTLISISSLGQV